MTPRRRLVAIATLALLAVALLTAVLNRSTRSTPATLVTLGSGESDSSHIDAPGPSVTVEEPLTTMPAPTDTSTAVQVSVTSLPLMTTAPTLPRVTIPTTQKPLTLTSTTTTTTTARPSARYPTGEDCGTPSGAGGFGATRSTHDDDRDLVIEIMPCHVFDGDRLQTYGHLDAPTYLVTGFRAEFGDGTTYRTSGTYPWSCDTHDRPNPYHANFPTHEFSNPGRYTVKIWMTVASCADWESTHTLGPEIDVAAQIDVFREGGPPPPP